MEPIQILIVNKESFFDKVISNPLVSFLLGSIVTIILSVIIQYRNEIMIKREKHLVIKTQINELLFLYKKLLRYLNPDTYYTPDYVVLDENYTNDMNYDKFLKNKKDKEIDKTLDEISIIKKSVIPIIDLYISKYNQDIFQYFFISINKIVEAFVPFPFIMKLVYSDKVKSVILTRTQTDYLNKYKELFEKIYLIESKMIQKKDSKKIHKEYNNLFNYDKFFSDIENDYQK